MHVRFGEERQGNSSTTPCLLLHLGCVANGLTYIERWTRPGRLSTSDSARHGTWKQRRRSSVKQSGMRAVRRRLLPWTAMPPPSRGARNEKRRPAPKTHKAALVEVSEQSDRTGSSRHQVQNLPHARVQKLLICCNHHCRSGTASSYSQSSILLQSPPPQRSSCACTLECCPRGLI